MNSINDKELLRQYGIDNPADIFSVIDKAESSYWQENVPHTGMIEYEFNTPVELMRLIDDYIDDKELQKLIVAAAFKIKEAYLLRDKDDTIQKESELPEFVYAF